MKRNPVIFRLLSGESVIGTLVNENETSYTVNRPYSINAILLGENPMNSKEFILLRDWLKFSLDLSTKIDKTSVLHTSSAEPKIIDLYEKKMDTDDNPHSTDDDIETIIKETFENLSEMDLSTLMDCDKDVPEGTDNGTPEEEIVEKLYKLQMPITEEFLDDLIELINLHTNAPNIDDIEFTDDCPEKFDDPNEFGNHHGHWPIDPKDYL